MHRGPGCCSWGAAGTTHRRGSVIWVHGWCAMRGPPHWPARGVSAAAAWVKPTLSCSVGSSWLFWRVWGGSYHTHQHPLMGAAPQGGAGGDAQGLAGQEGAPSQPAHSPSQPVFFNDALAHTCFGQGLIEIVIYNPLYLLVSLRHWGLGGRMSGGSSKPVEE